MSSAVAKGLAGVVVDETKICQINKDDNLLYYYGYEINDLTNHATYEEVSYLLAQGELPTSEQLQAYQNELAKGRALTGCIEICARAVARRCGPYGCFKNRVFRSR